LGSSAPVNLQQRLDAVRERIERACQRSGRSSADVVLLAVTKVFPAQIMKDAYALGLREFGENYVQEWESKAPEVGSLPGARVHLIGHLQSNKSAKACSIFDTIQTVDSVKLARRLGECGKPLNVMIEVKLSQEESKHGASVESVPAIAEAVRNSPNLHLTGLMTVPEWSEDPEAPRPVFRQLRELGRTLQIPGLSMGMSHDLETAIEEGSTCVRVGTALFGSRVAR
jgi:pyridoxal phosphate enzyme (YggS family)